MSKVSDAVTCFSRVRSVPRIASCIGNNAIAPAQQRIYMRLKQFDNFDGSWYRSIAFFELDLYSIK